MSPEDQMLVQLWVKNKITYEDALRRATSKDDVRLGIKLTPEFQTRPDSDVGDPRST
jgi:Tfp pilus assembly ATPase PilU